MNQASYIYAGNTENFETLVLENSTKGPVLVYYWADWAGPCRRFFPVLSKVIQDLGGRVLMVSIDTVAQQGLALRQGVNSVPLLKVFRHRREVEQVKGYIPEPELRRMLAQHLPQATDPRITRALRLYQSGEVEAGLTLLAQAALDNPDNPQLPLTLAKLLMAQQRFEEARNILRGLPEAMRDQPGISQLLAHLGFVLEARDAPTIEWLEERLRAVPDDTDAWYRLGAQRLMGDDYAGALEALVTLLRLDSGYREGAAKSGMQAIFQVLGNEGELVDKYRAAMFRALH